MNNIYVNGGYWRHAGYRRGKPLLRWTPHLHIDAWWPV